MPAVFTKLISGARDVDKKERGIYEFGGFAVQEIVSLQC